jgi:lincosamide nucleotidyltransferase
MLEQEKLIERVRAIAAADDRLEAALLYGSFAYGEGDANSDLDLYLFFEDDALAQVDPPSWLAQIAPVEFHYRNEYGIDTVIFPGLIRAEFHFEKTAGMDQIDQWDGWFPSIESCVLLDRTGDLTRKMERLIREPPPRTDRETVQLIVDNLINWMVMGANIVDRGEYVRSFAFHTFLYGYLAKFVRVIEGNTTHWINPFRQLEKEISSKAYDRFRECAVSFEPSDMRRAFNCLWTWAHELIDVARTRFRAEASSDLLAQLDSRFASLVNGSIDDIPPGEKGG